MPLKTSMDEEPNVNLTPMIDIVFLLMIFFMVGTKFTDMERTIDLEVPRVGSTQALTPAPSKRVINVFEDGRISFDNDIVDEQQLKERLIEVRSEYAEIGVVVRGDGDSRHRNIATVLAAVRDSGITNMSIAVNVAPKDSTKR
jgi:biopolymer transport protein ExbD